MVVDKHAKEQWILWFEDICREDVAIVGGKSASLSEMTSQTGVPVPYGFATIAQTYRTFLRKTDLDRKNSEMIANLTNVEDSRQLREISAEIRQVIVDAKLPKKFEEAIKQAYVDLAAKVGEEQPFVAVRFSATAEGLPYASFAGQQETYLNVRGADEVVERVKECLASMFTDRAVYYRTEKEPSRVCITIEVLLVLVASGSKVNNETVYRRIVHWWRGYYKQVFVRSNNKKDRKLRYAGIVGIVGALLTIVMQVVSLVEKINGRGW